MFRDKAKDAMRSGKVLRVHKHVATQNGSVVLGDDGDPKMDEDVAEFLYVGEAENYDSAVDRHAKYRREDGEWVEVFDQVATGQKINDLVSNNLTYFDDPEDAPVSPVEDDR